MADKKMELLAAYMKHQNGELKLKSLFEFMGLSHMLDRYIETRFRSLGLTRIQRRIISFMLYASDYTTQTELSRNSLASMDTINKSIAKLEKMGLTQSRPSKEDRRVRQVKLTDKGREMMETILPLRYQTFSQIMNCFSEEEMSVFLENIKRLQGHIRRLAEQSEDRVEVNTEKWTTC